LRCDKPAGNIVVSEERQASIGIENSNRVIAFWSHGGALILRVFRYGIV